MDKVKCINPLKTDCHPLDPVFQRLIPQAISLENV